MDYENLIKELNIKINYLSEEIKSLKHEAYRANKFVDYLQEVTIDQARRIIDLDRKIGTLFEIGNPKMMIEFAQIENIIGPFDHSKKK